MKKLMLTLSMAAALGALTFSVSATDKKDEKKDEKAKEYALKTCVVSGEKLDSMGKPHVFKHEGREVRLCCEPCKKDFKKEPSKYMKKLDDAEKAAAKK
jgi:YHS domain-containing protein